MATYLSEKDYLIKFAVDAYNRKYEKKIRYRDCSIKSIHPSYGNRWGYYIETLRGDDYVAIKLYFNLGKFDRVDIVRLEVKQNIENFGTLGDEVYVVTGEVAGFYYEDGIYRFRWIDSATTEEPIFEFMDGSFVEFMNGDLFMTMEAKGD